MLILFINSIQMFAGREVWMLSALAALQQRGHMVSHLESFFAAEISRRRGIAVEANG